MLPPTADSFCKVIGQFFSWLCKVGERGEEGREEERAAEGRY